MKIRNYLYIYILIIVVFIGLMNIFTFKYTQNYFHDEAESSLNNFRQQLETQLKRQSLNDIKSWFNYSLVGELYLKFYND